LPLSGNDLCEAPQPKLAHHPPVRFLKIIVFASPALNQQSEEFKP